MSNLASNPKPTVKDSRMEADEAELARMGYKQELQRELGLMQNFGASQSWSNGRYWRIPSLFLYGLNTGGPVVMVWGWLVVCFVSCFTMLVGLAMAGWFNLLGQVAVTTGISFACTNFISTACTMGTSFVPTPRTTIGIYAAVLFSQCLTNTFGVSLLHQLNNISVWWHALGTFSLVVAILAKAPTHQSGSFVFGQFIDITGVDGSGWGDRVSHVYVVVVGILMAQHTLTVFDASAHMTEETTNAAKSGSIGIVMAIGVSAILGWFLILGLIVSTQDLEGTLSSHTEQPVTQIFLDTVGEKGAIVLMVIVIGAMYFCGTFSITSNSRMMYAFPRDGVIPGSKFFAQVNPQWKSPIRTAYTGIGNNQNHVSRTPSPTPSELKELDSGAIDWKSMRSRKFWFRREWLWYYLLFVVTVVIVALMYFYHKQIVGWLTPLTTRMHQLKFGWLIPIAVLFVISFPPLFGHEIVAVLCGLVWGLWVGFGIVAAGTFLGEVGNFYAFKYCCRSRAEKAEKGKIWYACLARIVREGGFKIALIARLSAIPGHFTTALFAASGMNILVFSIAAILSMPKQFITVYLGVVLEQSGTATPSKKDVILRDTMVAVTILVTILAMWYILHLMNKAKPQVIYERRKARQSKLARAGYPYMHQHQVNESTDVFNPQRSDTDIPLTTTTHEPRYQQWDQHGRAIGYAQDPNIHSPAPRNPITSTSAKSLEEGSQNPFTHGRDQSLVVAGWDMDRTAPVALSSGSAINPPKQSTLSPPLANPHRLESASNLIPGAGPPVRPGSNTYETDYSLDIASQHNHAFNPFQDAPGSHR
ncbi:hypothetical protein CVT24_002104 [Panaeolus cyanescens]|uniref:Golgi apparatus membrane protein TVP38 n=1 Tax=Panaeolus cyanescens TaxID=181874 RepID=A0A409YI67_9AGAR|nr:hypothetical protein CVT24_002104 [Panaeolus cyanescens]